MDNFFHYFNLFFIGIACLFRQKLSISQWVTVKTFLQKQLKFSTNGIVLKMPIITVGIAETRGAIALEDPDDDQASHNGYKNYRGKAAYYWQRRSKPFLMNLKKKEKTSYAFGYMVLIIIYLSSYCLYKKVA